MARLSPGYVDMLRGRPVARLGAWLSLLKDLQDGSTKLSTLCGLIDMG